MTIKHLIYETANFIIDTPERPLIDRAEGGHIRIIPRIRVTDRTQLSRELAAEYMLLSMLVGEAMKAGLANRGIDIGLINYQDMGNWGVTDPGGPTMHMHLFGRATVASVQKYGEAVQLPRKESGFYDSFRRLDDEDIRAIQTEIARLRTTPKYHGI